MGFPLKAFPFQLFGDGPPIHWHLLLIRSLNWASEKTKLILRRQQILHQGIRGLLLALPQKYKSAKRCAIGLRVGGCEQIWGEGRPSSRWMKNSPRVNAGLEGSEWYRNVLVQLEVERMCNRSSWSREEEHLEVANILPWSWQRMNGGGPGPSFWKTMRKRLDFLCQDQEKEQRERTVLESEKE